MKKILSLLMALTIILASSKIGFANEEMNNAEKGLSVESFTYDELSLEDKFIVDEMTASEENVTIKFDSIPSYWEEDMRENLMMKDYFENDGFVYKFHHYEPVVIEYHEKYKLIEKAATSNESNSRITVNYELQETNTVKGYVEGYGETSFKVKAFIQGVEAKLGTTVVFSKEYSKGEKYNMKFDLQKKSVGLYL